MYIEVKAEVKSAENDSVQKTLYCQVYGTKAFS